LYAVDALGNCRGAPQLDEGARYEITILHGASPCVAEQGAATTRLTVALEVADGANPLSSAMFSFRSLKDDTIDLKYLNVAYQSARGAQSTGEIHRVDFLAQDNILWVHYKIAGKEYQCPVKLNLGEIAGL